MLWPSSGRRFPEEGQSIWSKRRQGFQPCFEAGIRELPFTITLIDRGHSSSPNTADVPHVTTSVAIFPMSSLLLVGTVLYLVMFSVTTSSGNGWLRGRDRVTEPLAWLMARDWTASAVKSATCTPSTSTVNRSVG